MRTAAVALVAMIGATSVLIGCNDRDDFNVYTLYRGPPTVGDIKGENARIHVATFDAAESEEYNRINCETARAGLAKITIDIRYWCEKGRYRP